MRLDTPTRSLLLVALGVSAALTTRGLAQEAPPVAEAAAPAGEAAAVASAQAAPVASSGTAAVTTAQAAQPGQPSLDDQRLQRLLQLTFDRSPAAVLEALTAREEEEPEQATPPADQAAAGEEPVIVLEEVVEVAGGMNVAPALPPGLPPEIAAQLQAQLASRMSAVTFTQSGQPGQPAAPGDPFAAELTEFQQDVTRGDWEAVKAYLAGLPEAHGPQVWRRLIALLGAPPGSNAQSTPDGKVQVMPMQVMPLGQHQQVTPSDVLALIQAAPAPLTDDDLVHLGRLVAAVAGQGHAIDELIAAWEAGAGPLGGTEAAQRHRVAAVLLEAGRPKEARAFAPADEEAPGEPKLLDLLVRLHLALHQADGKLEELEAAWRVNARLLGLPKLEAAMRRAALARAVELAPRVRDSLNGAWLEAAFAADPAVGRELLGAVGATIARTRQMQMRDPASRLRSLELQQAAVAALFQYAPAEAEALAPVLALLVRNWTTEAELTLQLDQSVQGGRPIPQYDSYGNLYFVPMNQYYQQRNNNMPLPIASAQALEVAPGERWRELAGTSVRPLLLALLARLHLKVGDEDAALPLVSTLARLPGEQERAQGIAEELVRVWTQQHDLNNQQNRTNRYVYFWGFDPRANGIPLTRSKQERNLAELAILLGKLSDLPLEPLDEALVVDAFVRTHGRAEVYRLEAITEVFGPPPALEAATLARLVQIMRANLTTLWRDPKVQKEEKTKRTDVELQAEVLRGYEVARTLVRDGLAGHPGDWRLLAADAALTFDYNDYAHRELGASAEYTTTRDRCYDRFAEAAAAYAAAVPEMLEKDETTEVFDMWLSASLGAVDLPRVSHEHVPDPRQPARIKAALAALPGEAAPRHMRRFAAGMFTQLSSVNPAAKFDYLRAAFEVAGEHEDAREARKVFEYYQDLVTEVKLRTRLDGSDRVGHERPFGVFVELRHTEAIERESGGFAKYLQNQNSVSYAWNYGRPLEDYRDKFEKAARAALEERFEVLSITFADPKVTSRGDPEPGWRVTPYAYVLLKARGPEVDKLPSLALDLDFLDTSGYAVLPVASAPLPLDARPAVGDPRPLADAEVALTLDERRAGEGVLVLEIQAKAHGLLPPLGELLDLTTVDPSFTLGEVEDPGVAASRLDLESKDLAVFSERRWLVQLSGREGLKELPKTFRFPDLKVKEATVLYQRYDDADLAATEQTVPLERRYGEEAPRWPYYAGGALLLALLAAAARAARRAPVEVAAGRYAAPPSATPFAVLALLQRLEQDGVFTDEATRAELRQQARDLERAHFSGDASDGADEPALAELARTWAERGNAGISPRP